MKFAALFGLAAIAATAVGTTLPAFAAEDDEPARVSRNWMSDGGTVSRGSAPNQRGSTRTTTSTRDTSGDDEPKVTYLREATRTSRNTGDDNDGSRYNNRRERQHEYGGLDPAEAARIRNAHRESDRRVTLHRDRDDHEYSVPSYSSRGYRRQHWWSSWW